jgi:hypothetical protein
VARFALFVLYVVFAASCLPGSTDASLTVAGSADPAFSSIPFDQWLTQPDRSHIHWTAHVSDTELSTHQRLISRVYIQVDGAELAKRRGKGQFLVLVQVNDEQGHAWQNHQEMDLERIEAGMKANDAVFSQLLFLRPGDYRIAIAVFATATAEHSVVKRRLHVAALKNDPLPGAWRDLPAVEFVSPSRPPDSWYLPSVDGKLHLAVETHEPVHVNLIVNLTPSERLTGSRRVQNRNLSVLLPATKVLSEVDWGTASFSLALLDLSRRRITYHQDKKGPLDWEKAASSLEETNPGIIDVKSLENRKRSAQFFLDDIGLRIGAAKTSKPRRSPVVIVLSSTVEFEPGQELNPGAWDSPTNARVFYIRYQPFPPIYYGRPSPGPRIIMPDGGPSPRGGYPAPLDQLAPLLKPLEPQLFEVSTPAQFRKTLATILDEISKL